MTEIERSKALLGLTAEIVSAHVKNNTVAAGELPQLIEQVFAALRDAGQAPQPAPPVPARAEPERQQPVVHPRKSVFPDYIICLEDGRKLKTLKRHLRSTYNMTPEQYREKWDLPPEYPMVAPNYAEHRSVLAKQLGLGRKPAAAPAAPVEQRAEERVEAPVAAPVAAKASSAAARAPDPDPPARSAAEPPKAPVFAREPAREPALEHPRDSRTEHTAASVFAKFPRQAEATAEPPPDADADPRKPRRKPFSKQLARTMRP